jgi:glycosyltransferase A (GT-A) superfamily protein (DUF2064 family)
LALIVRPLPHEYIQKAIDDLILKNADVVLGPATDGGFYLIGLRKSIPSLFKNISWSTSAVYQQICEKTITAKLNLFKLPSWYDVDTPLDLLFCKKKCLPTKYCSPALQKLING